MDAMRNAMRELLKNAKAHAFENPAHPCPCFLLMEQLTFIFVEKALVANKFEKKKSG